MEAFETSRLQRRAALLLHVEVTRTAQQGEPSLAAVQFSALWANLQIVAYRLVSSEVSEKCGVFALSLVECGDCSSLSVVTATRSDVCSKHENGLALSWSPNLLCCV